MDLEEALMRVGVCKGVFSFLYPEVKAVVDKAFTSRPHYMYERSWQQGQDDVHEKFLSEWKAWAAPWVHSLEDFEHAYYCNGSSEAIRDTIADYVANFNAPHKPRIHMFEGDYEGYAAFAEAYGIEAVRYDRNNWREELEDGANIGDNEIFFLSQPSAIDGNYWEEYTEFIEFISELEVPRVKVMLDLAYLGCTTNARPPKFYTGPNCIDKVFFSLSKVFGVYYHRIGGVLSRTPMPGLYGNKWFKNLFSIELGRRLMYAYKPNELSGKYKATQVEAIEAFNTAYSCQFSPSDVVLLGNSDAVPLEFGSDLFKRADRLRLCVTPFLDMRANP